MQKKTLSIVLALLILVAGFFFFGTQKKETVLPPAPFEESSSSVPVFETTNEVTSTAIISPKPQTIETLAPEPKKEYANPTDACIGGYLEKGETDVNKILSMCLGVSQ